MAGGRKPHWQKLSWHAARRQWKKYRDGKTYYLGTSGVNKTSRAAHDDALEEWRKIEIELDEKSDPTNPQSAPTEKERMYAEQLGRRMPDASLLDYVVAIQDEQCEPGAAESVSANDTVGTHIKKFLASFDTQIKLDARSHARRSSLRAHLGRFSNWAPPGENDPLGNRNIAEVNAALLADYYEYLASLLADKAIGHYTARDSLVVAKQFIRWAWERELCGLPRNIDSRNLTFPVPASTVEVYEVQDVIDQIEVASERSKLYVLLAANCGMTQIDIAKLQQDEVDLKTGTITRKRSKTRKHKGAPTVTYKLWPETLALLKQFIAKDGELALLTETGEQLVREWTTDDGRPMKVDTVRSAHRRLLQKVNNKRKRVASEKGANPTKIAGSFKWFRATSANLLEQESWFKPVVQLYLGHAPTTVAERHYTRGDQKLLDKAVKWLREQYGR